MKKQNKKHFYFAMILIFAFILCTVLVRFVDVEAIGPEGTTVGFATLNALFHNLTGVNMMLYTITDWLGLVPFFFAMGFGILGLTQWMKRKNIFKVDFGILALGVFYIIVMIVYFLFEMVVVNYRPILINGLLEASYPSSTTLLGMCIMPTSIMQFDMRIKNKIIKNGLLFILGVFTAFMVVGRLVSGVHWLTDIIAGMLLSSGLVTMYGFVLKEKSHRIQN